MALLSQGLLPASFRGAPFAVVNDEMGGGRRQVVHQYPGRDEPWAEDLGRAARRWRFRGFIVDGDVLFAGGPIQLQRALLISALEKQGSGTLTHPTLGIVSASVLGFTIGADLGAGRMSSVEIEFVESGKRSFPSLLASSTGLLSSANLAKAALVVDGVRAVALAARSGGRRADLVVTTTLWSGKVKGLGGDATALSRLAAVLPGSLGRFASGRNAGLNGARATPYSSSTTVSELVAAASEQRVAIAEAADGATTAAGAVPLTDASSLAAALAGLVLALAKACADPADGIRLLEQLVGTAFQHAEAATPIGTAVGVMVRRAAAVAIMNAAADYQPASTDDANAVSARLASLIDLVATQAADAGDDASYKALRAGRAAIVQDLRARAATLAHIATFRPAAPLPALALAQRYYRDAARADQLVTQLGAGIVSPLFMPAEYQALAA
jgi:prophage DNA circulation protein